MKLNRFGIIFLVMFVGAFVMSGGLIILVKSVITVFAVSLIISELFSDLKSTKKGEKGKQNLPPDLERKFARRAAK